MRSLSRNLSKLQNLLDTINYMFSVIAISETSLKKIFHAVDIDGYRSLHSYRPGLVKQVAVLAFT